MKEAPSTVDESIVSIVSIAIVKVVNVALNSVDETIGSVKSIAIAEVVKEAPITVAVFSLYSVSRSVCHPEF